MSGWWLLAGIVLFIIGSFASAWALAKVLNRRSPPASLPTAAPPAVEPPEQRKDSQP